MPSIGVWFILCTTLLLLLLSRFSRVWLCETPYTAAHQAPPSLGFSRKNTGVGCHFLLQWVKVKSESEVAQSCLTLSNAMDHSLPGSPVHGIFQARVLEWVATMYLLMCIIITSLYTYLSQKELLAGCNGLNACVLSKLICWNPNLTVLTGGWS